MKKRMFQILDDMNVADGENNTDKVRVGNQLVSAQLKKNHGEITMGVDRESVMSLLNTGRELIPIILIVDRKEYLRIANETENK